MLRVPVTVSLRAIRASYVDPYSTMLQQLLLVHAVASAAALLGVAEGTFAGSSAAASEAEAVSYTSLLAAAAAGPTSVHQPGYHVFAPNGELATTQNTPCGSRWHVREHEGQLSPGVAGPAAQCMGGMPLLHCSSWAVPTT